MEGSHSPGRLFSSWATSYKEATRDFENTQADVCKLDTWMVSRVSLTLHRSFQGVDLVLMNLSFCCLYKHLRRGCELGNASKFVVFGLQLPYVKFVFMAHLRRPAHGKGL